MQLYQRESRAQVFTCEFCENSKNTFFKEKLLVTTSKNRSLTHATSLGLHYINLFRNDACII